MPLEKATDEARRILEASRDRNITLKLFGGVAIYFTCPSAIIVNPQRKYVDIDFMAHEKQSREIVKFFPKIGYAPRERFNALHGFQRLIFNDIEHGRRVDIFLDVFEMSHKFNFKKRMDEKGDTLPLADLLATKLQVFEINEKDLKDALTLFVDHEISNDDTGINGPYLADLASSDWGIYRTFENNIQKIQTTLQALNQDVKDVAAVASPRIEKLKKLLDDSPKSLKWKLRARVGESRRWYELPEEDREVVDSRMAR